jgi:hypothetical protein
VSDTAYPIGNFASRLIIMFRGVLHEPAIPDHEREKVIGALRASHPNGVDAVLDLVNGKDAIRRDAEILKVATIFCPGCTSLERRGSPTSGTRRSRPTIHTVRGPA